MKTTVACFIYPGNKQFGTDIEDNDKIGDCVIFLLQVDKASQREQ